jgi:hypothetical protein
LSRYWVVGPDLELDLLGERGEGEDVGAGFLEAVCDRGSFSARASMTRTNWALTAAASG